MTELANFFLKPYKGPHEPKFRIVLTDEGEKDAKGRKLTHYLVRQVGPGEPAIYEGRMHLEQHDELAVISLLSLLIGGTQEGFTARHFVQHHAKAVMTSLREKSKKRSKVV